jgi:hypothetical protein
MPEEVKPGNSKATTPQRTDDLADRRERVQQFFAPNSLGIQAIRGEGLLYHVTGHD